MQEVTRVVWLVSGYIDAPAYEPEPSVLKRIIEKIGGIIKRVK